MNVINSCHNPIKYMGGVSVIDYYAGLPTIALKGSTNLILDFESGNPLNTNSGTKTTAPTCSLTNTGTTSYFVLDGVNKKFGNGSLSMTSTTETTHSITIPITTSASGGFTQSFWFRYTSTVAYASIFQTNNLNIAGAVVFLGVSFASVPTAISFMGGIVANTTNTLSKDVTLSTYGISANGNWNHVAWSITSGGAVTICINGTNVNWGLSNVAWTSGQDANRYLGGRAMNFYVGYSPANPMKMTGNIDAVRYYNVALSLAEMQSLYNNGC